MTQKGGIAVDTERYVTQSPEETEQIGRRFAATLKPGDVVALRGDLGAGKTAFVRGVASLLTPGAEVQSPTFSLLRIYEGPLPLYHFDLYRTRDPEEVYEIGLDDCLDRGGAALIEWSERAEGALPHGTITVTLENPSHDDRRQITVRRGAPC
ncbi:MAG: tRNA (adenosine(37)-N6)-threonylcarbamoyltransferase complex ATPase subunit type 1 TsaE [Clostridia bacterium]|nr:tRNA (adenosine(37)-N6)-threonylcarbamoyltransferase complex ATPase subunit type 1 TsaE [Clostridia bacterium]